MLFLLLSKYVEGRHIRAGVNEGAATYGLDVDFIPRANYVTESNLFLRQDKGTFDCNALDYMPGYYNAVCLDSKIEAFSYTSSSKVTVASCSDLDFKFCSKFNIDIYGIDGAFMFTCTSKDSGCVVKANQYTPVMPWYLAGLTPSITRYAIVQPEDLDTYTCNSEIDNNESTNIFCEGTGLFEEKSLDCDGGDADLCMAASCDDFTSEQCGSEAGDFVLLDFKGDIVEICTADGQNGCTSKEINPNLHSIMHFAVIENRSSEHYIFEQPIPVESLTCSDLSTFNDYKPMACDAMDLHTGAVDCTLEPNRCRPKTCADLVAQITGDYHNGHGADMFDKNGRIQWQCGSDQGDYTTIHQLYMDSSKMAETTVSDFTFRNWNGKDIRIDCSKVANVTIDSKNHMLCKGSHETPVVDCSNDPSSCESHHCGYIDNAYCGSGVSIWDWDKNKDLPDISAPKKHMECSLVKNPDNGDNEQCLQTLTPEFSKPQEAGTNRYVIQLDRLTQAFLCPASDGEWYPALCEAKAKDTVYSCVGLKPECSAEKCSVLSQSVCDSDIVAINSSGNLDWIDTCVWDADNDICISFSATTEEPATTDDSILTVPYRTDTATGTLIPEDYSGGAAGLQESIILLVSLLCILSII